MRSLTSAQARTRRRPRWAALIVLLCAAMLTACGADLKTTLDLKTPESGTRTITATYDDSDGKLAERTKGGSSAIDASIKKHVPGEISYKGLSKKGTSYEAVFTVTFASLEEYETKISALLKASGSTIKPTIEISNKDNALVSGLIVKENFTSADLLGWLSAGLVEDDVIEESDKINVFSNETKNSVSFSGKTYTSEYPTLRVSEVKDHGFDSVAVRVAPKDSGYEATVSLGSNSPIDAIKTSKIKDYFSKATPEGAQLSEGLTGQTGGSSDGYTLTIPASSLEDLSKKLAQALGSEKNRIEAKDSNDPSRPLTAVRQINATLDCTALCTLKSTPNLQFEFAEDSAWTSTGQPSNAVNGTLLSYSAQLEKNLSFTEVAVKTEIGRDGGGTQTYAYTLPTDAAASAGEALTALLTPQEGAGSLEKSEKDGNTTYTATITGKDEGELNSRITAYAGGGHVRVDRPSGMHVWPEYGVSVATPILENKLKASASRFTHEVTLPGMNSVADSDAVSATGLKAEGRTVRAEGEQAHEIRFLAKGPNSQSFILWGIIAALVLGVLAALWFFRKRLAALWSRRDVAVAQAKKASAAARTQAAALGSAAAAGAATATSALAQTSAEIDTLAGPSDLHGSDSRSDLPWDQRFTEHDLR